MRNRFLSAIFETEKLTENIQFHTAIMWLQWGQDNKHTYPDFACCHTHHSNIRQWSDQRESETFIA